MSELGRGLLVAGVLGALLALAYLRACAWADYGLMTAHARRRVARCERRAPEVLAGSLALAATGLVLGVAGAL
jgi:hypothetical protein